MSNKNHKQEVRGYVNRRQISGSAEFFFTAENPPKKIACRKRRRKVAEGISLRSQSFEAEGFFVNSSP